MLKDIREEAKKIDSSDPRSQLFSASILNETIFLKNVEATHEGTNVFYTIETILYFPYNHENIYEGGDSVALSDPKLEAKIANKVGHDLSKDERVDHAHDNLLLQMIEAIPTFDPFLLKCKAEQLEIAEKIHPSFFNVSEAEWKSLQKNIRGKIRALVERAIGDNARGADPIIEKHVTNFLNKIWEARDVEGIEDFVSSLGIPHDKAPDLFFAWKAICYYQSKFSHIEESLRSYFAWIGGKDTSIPKDYAMLPMDTRDSIKRSMRIVRQRIRENHGKVLEILNDYEGGYREFIDEGNPEKFKEFLSVADELCNKLAAGLASHTHAINMLHEVTSRWGNRLLSRQFLEVLDCLTTVYGTATHPVIRKKDTGEKSTIVPLESTS